MFAEGDKATSIDAAQGVQVDLLQDGRVRGVSIYLE
jgi:hypothetical protein